MRRVSKKVKDKIEKEGWNNICLLFEEGFGKCDHGIVWHHAWLYAGKQIDEAWAIVGLCPKHHETVHSNLKAKEIVHLKSLKRATKEDLEEYPRKDWAQIKNYLTQKYE